MGEIMPMETSAFIILKIPKNITTSPAVLKNTPDCAFLWMPSELKERSERTGKVPRAKASIIKLPCQKLPRVRVYICIDWVNPQGRKKVATPRRIGVKV